uniref:Zinc finger protein 292a n=1 Tax=Sinocyclocheilus anshuiensis TaxID=1608454 RepID=A0A671KV67_9TELE
MQMAHGILQAHGNSQLHTLLTLAEENGLWSNATLCSLLSSDIPNVEKVHEFLSREGPELLHMRIKHLIKQKHMEKAARLAKTCAEFPEFGGKKNFKQIYLVCLCEIKPQEELMKEIKEVDCKEALDMICNLESEEDEKGALSLCTAFFKRQLLSGDAYCAWELTLFWSKLLIRLESKQAFLEQCRLVSRLSGSVYHILLLIKVIQAEVEKGGLSVCIEMCIQALKIGVNDNEGCNISICKTISCLLPLDLEVKQACQLTEFLIKPSLDSYYAVETVFNEPDQKLEQDDPPILNSLRCDLLLALKTKWPFDPEFWDWKTLKRQCLALMGQEAAAILSTNKFTDSEDNEVHDPDEKYFKHLHFTHSPTYELSEVEAEKKTKREMKKMRERGFVSARFRNWQAYMQYCVLCDKEFLGHRIVKHALKHVQDGIFRCPICTETFETRAILEPHVASHVKQSCKERLAAMGVSKKRPSSDTKLTPASSTLSKEDKIKSSSPKQGNPVRDVNNTKLYSCPVKSCQKVFKYFRNLVAHVKAHKNEQEATHFLEIQSQKPLCQYCHRQFVNVTHLNDHLQMHCDEKPYFCIQLGCNCSFSSHAELLIHRKEHAEFKAQCAYPNCERIFIETYLLYDHEAQHYMSFSCKSHNCDKVFYTLSELDLHQKGHKRQGHSAADVGSPSQLELPAATCPALELPPSQNKEPDGSKTSHCLERTKQLHLESCYVKLHETQTLLKDKKLFSFPQGQLEPSTLKSTPSVTKANREEGLTHVCPFETCTRKYSTSKSLSRHVKNVHSEAFEEWKLSKKYKRIAEIAAKKSSSEHPTTSSQIPKWTSRSRQTEHTAFLDSVIQIICCRCYREFSSTKSLGGHLSKRSQCKPVDEIDLTADLPVSFLDFLNDPDISTVQMPLPANDIHEHNNKSCIYSTNLHDLSSEAGTRNDQCHTIKDSVQNEQKCILKPFRCKEDCVYGAMTKEALFKHLSRVHDYSEDRINEMKKNPDKLAPYNCHLCSKAFTRTTGLKIHYKNVHHFSKEELSGLKIGLGYRKIRKSTENVSENAHTSLVIDQGNDSLSEHTDTCRTVEVSQKSVVNLDGFSATNVKLEGPSLTEENRELNEPGIFAMQDDAQIVYRPYRCVHEGCVAAFSIQQNLILHYRAMHQSECDNKDSAKETDGVVQVQEYRCQVKQCSKVVSKVTSLLKHYLLLHRCTLEKASALLSGVEVGTFQCDQSKCSAHFTCHLKYIDHIKNDHKAIKVSADGDFESVDLTFRCQFEGCDRVYTTKSNLLRHLMKKHDATFETMKEKQENGIGDDVQAKKLSAGSNNGKENIANNNIKMKRKNSKKREDKAQNHWMTIEKPALKSTDEASAMCNERLPLQYPCMIESCDSVMSAEHSIIKHYTTHGVTERYIEDRRSQFIFCKKSNDMPRADSTSKNVEVEETVFDEDQTENSKVSSQDVDPEPATEVIVNEGFTSTTMPVIKRKRGRPRKSECRNKISVERKQSLRNCSGEHVKCMLKVSGSILNSSNSQGNHIDNEVALKLYKPSEFETSVLKFDEDSLSNPTKRQRTLQPIIQERDQVQCIVNFRNPLKIETVKNVKIVMYENLSTCSELLLRQLQDMQPMVILKRGLHS